MKQDNQFQTPDWCCKYMASIIPCGCLTILEPTPGKGNLVRAILERNRPGPELPYFFITTPERFEDVPAGSRFDCVVMNPPFANGQGLRILEKCMDMSDYIIALMPWLNIINSSKRLKMLMDWGLRQVVNLPRNTFPGSRVQTCILVLEKGNKDVTKLLNIESMYGTCKHLTIERK